MGFLLLASLWEPLWEREIVIVPAFLARQRMQFYQPPGNFVFGNKNFPGAVTWFKQTWLAFSGRDPFCFLKVPWLPSLFSF